MALMSDTDTTKWRLFCFMYNGLSNNMGNLFQLTNPVTRSSSPENSTGE